MGTSERFNTILLSCFLWASLPPFLADAANTNPNHDTPQAQTGDCTYCHVSLNTGANLPKQAACLECHVRWNAATYSLEIVGLTLAYGMSPVKTPVHVISSNSGQEIKIYDFAACFSCHSDAGIAPVISPYHGSKVNGSQWVDLLEDANDDARTMFYFHPGHGTFNAMSYVFNNRNGLFNNKLLRDYNSSFPGAVPAPDCSGGWLYPFDIAKSVGNPCYGIPPYRFEQGQSAELPAPGYEMRTVIPFDHYGNDPEPTYIEVPYFPEIPPPANDFCPDMDNDGWAVCDATCNTAGLNCGDCDDNDSGINPGATDIPCDGFDQDCSGSDVIDQTCQSVCGDYTDKTSCQAVSGCSWSGSPKNGICQDDVPQEVCDDGIDNDGDTLVDCADSDCAGVGSCPAQADCSSFSGDQVSCLANGCRWNSAKQTCR